MTSGHRNRGDGVPLYPFDLKGGDLFSVPGARGRFSSMRFDDGLLLYLGEFQATETCTLAVNPSLDTAWVGGSLHLVGETVMELPDGRSIPRRGQQTLLSRIDMPGTCFHLKAGAHVRHVSVVATLSWLRERLDTQMSTRMGAYLDETREVCVANAITTTSRMRGLATSLFAPRSQGGARRIRLEGAAALFLADAIDSAFPEEPASAPDAADWQGAALQATIERIRADLSAPNTVQTLAAQVDMSASRLNRLFVETTGNNCAAFLRAERMTAAQALLASGTRAVKEVAAAVGYAHVGNFSRAYRDHFGETPSREGRRKR
ncbi:helix-turn-helix domain-containing protein [Stappia stellulata]|uniref:helix-turn-helix domain-containing protein n=1 Tax=Stappia stellulata TaxID=71235 RepID=UPI000421A2AC|nr:AraC family transcriptional regulator [Stappia stellulata]